MSKCPKFLTSAADAARVCGLSRRQFDRLVKASILPQHGPREFDLASVVQALVHYVEQGREGGTTLAEAKLRTERERSRKLAFENAIKAGELIFASQVAEVLNELAAVSSAGLEAIPGRHAATLASVTDPAEMRSRLLEIVREYRTAYAAKIEAIAERMAKQ